MICKLTVPGVSLLMTGSPHTSMPYAMHHFKPRPLAGVFFMFRTNGMQRVLGYVGNTKVQRQFRLLSSCLWIFFV